MIRNIRHEKAKEFLERYRNGLKLIDNERMEVESLEDDCTNTSAVPPDKNMLTYRNRKSGLLEKYKELDIKGQEIELPATTHVWVRSQANPKANEDRLIRLVDARAALHRHVAKLNGINEEIRDAINNSCTGIHARLLKLRYCENQTFSSIADRLGFSTRYILQKHLEALDMFCDCLEAKELAA